MTKRHLFQVGLGMFTGAFLLFLLIWNISAQGTAPVVSILHVDDAEFPAMRVIVAVSDINGRALPGLTQDAFLVSEDGESVDVLAVKEITRGLPLYLALAIDTSGSMKGEPLQATRDAVQTLVDQLTPDDRVALITFGTEVGVAVPLTVTHRAVITALQKVTLTNYTRLYDGAYQAIRTLQGVPPGRRAVVLMTDGQDTKSTLTLEDVVQEAQRFAVPLYIIGYGQQIQVNVLERMAQRTGGAFFQAPSVEEIPTAFSQVFDILRRAYEIKYLSNVPADGKEHELRVTLTIGGTSVQVVNRFTASRGNFGVQLKMKGLPDSEVAKRIWRAMGKQPVSTSIPYVTEQVLLFPEFSGAGRVTQVQYALDKTVLKRFTRQPFTFTWDASQVVPGVYTLSVTAHDHVGNKAADTRQVAVIPPIYITFQHPQAEATVTGTVPITVALTAIYPISDIRLKVDGQELGRPQLNSAIPAGAETKIGYVWTTQRLSEGKHALQVFVTTEAGRVFSATHEVNVGKHIVVTITEPEQEATLNGPVRVVAHVASDAPIDKVRFLVDDKEVAADRVPPYEAQIHTGDFTRGTHTISVVAQNTAGQEDQASVTVTMIPATRSNAAFMTLLAFGFLVLLGIPLVFWALRRRKEGQGEPNGGVDISEGVPGRQLHQPAGWLLLKEGNLPQQQYQLYVGENRIGRNREFADIWVPDMSVSRQHAIITIREGQVVLTNLNIHNPTFVNGRPVTDTIVLHDGDEIRMGKTTFTFRT